MNASDLPVDILPPINRTMRDLDRGFFRKSLPISAAMIFDKRDIHPVRRSLESTGELFSIWPVKSLVPDSETPELKCLLLNQAVNPTERTTWSTTLASLVDQGKIKIHPHDLTLTYNDWGMKLILDAVLPELPAEEAETPAGFSIIGHVAHVNLRDQYLPYKHLIGQVLLDKNPTITTVINKLNDVGTDSEFRTFPYEVLAGPDDLDVTVRQSDCEFRFNFGKVYWNPRLDTEHARIIEKFHPGEAVCDVMAGVGPFAVPAAKRKVFVWANDLNPDCHEALEWARKRNKVDQYLNASCMDGRKFIRWAADTLWKEPRAVEELGKGKLRKITIKQEPQTFNHFVMNLPKTALEFLSSFQGLYQRKETLFEPYTSSKLPMVHIYLFTDRIGSGTSQTNEEEAVVCHTVSTYLGHRIKPDTPGVELRYVRLVSPNRKYYRASFRLPAEVAFAARSEMPAVPLKFVPFSKPNTMGDEESKADPDVTAVDAQSMPCSEPNAETEAESKSISRIRDADMRAISVSLLEGTASADQRRRYEEWKQAKAATMTGQEKYEELKRVMLDSIR